MTRVSPPELERRLPGPHESTSVTSAPRESRFSAVQPPKAPAPTTTIRGLVDAPKSVSRCAASGTAAAHLRNVRRETVIRSERHPRRDADRPRLTGEIANACARTALLIE